MVDDVGAEGNIAERLIREAGEGNLPLANSALANSAPSNVVDLFAEGIVIGRLVGNNNGFGVGGGIAGGAFWVGGGWVSPVLPGHISSLR